MVQELVINSYINLLWTFAVTQLSANLEIQLASSKPWESFLL